MTTPTSNDNPKLPTLDPWVLKTKPPADRFVFERNPYYFRVDPQGHQLPYIDKVVFSDRRLQAHPGQDRRRRERCCRRKDLRFADYTFLKEGEKDGGYRVLLWQTGRGSSFTLYPQPDDHRSGVAQAQLRDVRFRRACRWPSTGTRSTRSSITAWRGRAPTRCCRKARSTSRSTRQAYAAFDPAAANRLLDEIGLTKRDERRLPPAARRAAADDHRRHRGRSARGVRRAGADPRQLGRRSASGSSPSPSSATCSATASSPATA